MSAECEKCGMPPGSDERWADACPIKDCPEKLPEAEVPKVGASDEEARRTFDGWIQQKLNQGYDEKHLLLLAMISINLLFDATARWQDMEYLDDPKSAPLWLKQREGAQVLKLLRGSKSIEARSVRRAINELFPDLNEL